MIVFGDRESGEIVKSCIQDYMPPSCGHVALGRNWQSLLPPVARPQKRLKSGGTDGCCFLIPPFNIQSKRAHFNVGFVFIKPNYTLQELSDSTKPILSWYPLNSECFGA